MVERSSNDGLLEAVMVEEEEVTQEILDRVTLFAILNGVNLTNVSCIEVPYSHKERLLMKKLLKLVKGRNSTLMKKKKDYAMINHML